MLIKPVVADPLSVASDPNWCNKVNAFKAFTYFKLVATKDMFMGIEEIWSEYQNSLKAFLYKNISNPSDAEDLLQDILIKTYQSIDNVKENHKIKSWIFQIANHAIIDFYRKQGVGSKVNGQQLWYQQDEKTLFNELSQCVTPFIKGLPDNEAELLTAIELEGVSQKEYAALKGIKYSTLKSRVKKSRQNLYQLFNQCCVLSINSKGNLVDYSPKKTACSSC